MFYPDVAAQSAAKTTGGQMSVSILDMSISVDGWIADPASWAAEGPAGMGGILQMLTTTEGRSSLPRGPRR
jgi:hypothetical protein